MSDFINKHKENFDKIIEHYKKEISNLRIGRAKPSLVENIKVNAYGTPTPVVHLASILATDPKTISIQPWDKNLLKEMEKALQQADLGCSPLVKDNLIILNIPSLTEETRKEIIKKLNHQSEESRVSLRGHREKVKEQVVAQEKEKEISEDEKFKMLEELDNLVKNYNEQIRELSKKKEEEIMTI